MENSKPIHEVRYYENLLSFKAQLEASHRVVQAKRTCVARREIEKRLEQKRLDEELRDYFG